MGLVIVCNELQTCRRGGGWGGHCLVMMHKQHVQCKSTETGFLGALECFRMDAIRYSQIRFNNKILKIRKQQLMNKNIVFLIFFHILLYLTHPPPPPTPQLKKCFYLNIILKNININILFGSIRLLRSELMYSDLCVYNPPTGFLKLVCFTLV